MKANSGLFIILLTIWMGASTYWYVCKIKDHCNKNELSEETEISEKEVVLSIIEDPIKEELTTEEIVEDVKSKISAGYTVFYFPENSIENNNIEIEFDEFASNLKIYLDENSEDKIEITGHTDNIGSDLANMKFGLKRAKFIKNIITKKGILANRILVKSKGETEPITSNDTEEGKRQNRRVVITLIDN